MSRRVSRLLTLVMAVATISILAQRVAANPSSTSVSATVSVDFMGGETTALAAEGEFVYVATGSRVAVLRIDPPGAMPELVAESRALSSVPADVAVGDGRLYVSLGTRGFQEVHISDTQDLTPGAITDIGGRADLVLCGDDRVFVSDKNGKTVSAFRTAPSAPPTFVGRTAEYGLDAIHDMAYADGFLYIAAGQSGVLVFRADGADLALHAAVEHTPAVGLTVGDGVLAVQSETLGDTPDHEPEHWIRLFDITDPASPQQRGSIRLEKASNRAILAGSLLAARSRTTLWLIDVEEPEQPRLLSSTRIAPSPYVVGDMAYRAGHLYLATTPSHEYDTSGQGWRCRGSGVLVVNVEDPADIAVVARWVRHEPGDVRQVKAEGTVLYVRDKCGVGVWDISEPNYPRFQASVVGEYGVAYMAVAQNRLATVDDNREFAVIDVSDGRNPQTLQRTDLRPLTEGRASAVAALGNYAYVATHGGDLLVMALGGTAPAGTHVGSLGLPEADLRSAAATSNALYLAAEDWGVWRVGILDPHHPDWAASSGEQAAARALAITEDGYLLVISEAGRGQEGRTETETMGSLWVMAVEGENALRSVGHVEFEIEGYLGPQGWEVSEHQHRVAVTTGREELVTFDIRDLAHPRLAKRTALPSEAWSVAIAGEHTYLAVRDGGVGQYATTELMHVGRVFMPLAVAD